MQQLLWKDLAIPLKI